MASTGKLILNCYNSSCTQDRVLIFGSRVGFSGTPDLTALFSFRKIQDGGGRHLRTISNGHVSGTGRPILFMVGFRMGFSGTAY